MPGEVTERHWKNRGKTLTPINKGLKSVPTGKPCCLKNKIFVLTGVLDSLEREEAVALIKKYGGKVRVKVDSSVTHVLAGLESGPTKLYNAMHYGVHVIDEDGLFEMLTE